MTKDGPPAQGLGMGLRTPHRKKKRIFFMNLLPEPRTWKDSWDKRPKQQNMNLRWGHGMLDFCIG
jgi:hypothetical protein